MNVTICMGSACFLKGSDEVVTKFIKIINEKGLRSKINICGAFCMGHCGAGVSVEVDGEYFSVAPENAERFFEDKVLSKLTDNT